MLNDNMLFHRPHHGYYPYSPIDYYDPYSYQSDRQQIMDEEERRQRIIARKKAEGKRSERQRRRRLTEEQRLIEMEKQSRRQKLLEAEKRRIFREEDQERRESLETLRGYQTERSQHRITPKYRVVQGPFGQIYRDFDDIKQNIDETDLNVLDSEMVQPRTSQGQSNQQYDFPNRTQKIAERKRTVNGPLRSTVTFNNCFNVTKQQDGTAGRLEKKNAITLPILVGDVEDASDDEMENDEFKSVWRNIHPSHGQWMEPIENYDNPYSFKN